MDWNRLYTGELFGYTKQQNREELLNDINKHLNSTEENNAKIILHELEKFGGKKIDFKNGPKNVILLCATTCWDDYYYIYYDINKQQIGTNTCVDGISCINETVTNIRINNNYVNDLLETYLTKHYYTEVPFTPLYKI